MPSLTLSPNPRHSPVSGHKASTVPSFSCPLTRLLSQDAIKTLIEQRFDAIAETQPTEAMPTPPHHANGLDDSSHRLNGVKHEEDAASDVVSNEIQVSTVPSKKRSSSMVEDEDARLARELQAQENQLARGRQTRGGHGAPKPKSKPKKKSSAKVKAGDDSDVDTEDSGTPKKRKAGGGFQKEFNLSYSLAELVGTDKVRTSLLWPFVDCYADEDGLTSMDSYPDPRSSKSCGSTSRQTTCKNQATSDRYAVTSGCRRSSSRARSTCSR